jgi:hypothetical protein
MQDFDEIRQRDEMLGTDSEAVLDKASEIYNLKRRGRLLPDADIFYCSNGFNIQFDTGNG